MSGSSRRGRWGCPTLNGTFRRAPSWPGRSAYLEVSCLAQLGFASKIHSFATTQARCREAIALADRYGWGTEPVIAPALMTLAGTMVWLGEFDEGERWLRRTARALQTDTGPDIRLLLHTGWDTARWPRPPS